MTQDGPSPWDLATLALHLLTIAPQGLRGISVRARAGPVRERFIEGIARSQDVTPRIHPTMPRDALFGGMDVSATLSEGRLVVAKGVLSGPGIPVLTMAERCPPDRAGELAAWMDRTARPLILLDEGAEPGETAPSALLERVAFHVPLDGIGRLEATSVADRDLGAARERLAKVRLPTHALTAVTTLATRLGIGSMRAPIFALTAARALAARDARTDVTDEDIEIAARLVLGPRATILPGEDDRQAQPDTEQDETAGKGNDPDQRLPEDILVEAIKPHLNPDLLDIADMKGRQGARGSGAGSRKKSNRRGRPLPSRPGRLNGGGRVDLVATLRSAAPWQSLRGRGTGPVRVLPSDIRIRRFEEKSDRLLVFAVDASGSAAMARLAEAKGAVEVMLSEAYANRDHVSLITFRGDAAEVLLPPTRSLVQTKRRLAALPGGGGTPLASGLRAAGDLALHARAQGLTPTVALLTDGRANIALDGTANRAEARDDATRMAHWLRAEGLSCVVLDTSRRADPALKVLSDALSARYVPLPQADARTMGRALGMAIGDGLDT